MQLVAPYMGAWIETLGYDYDTVQARVAPYMGAWIETRSTEKDGYST